MNAPARPPPRYFVGLESSFSGYRMYPVYDRRRLVERRMAMEILCWCDDKGNAEAIAAAMNCAHSEAK